MSEPHPIHQYFEILQTLRAHMEMEFQFCGKQIPSWGTLPSSAILPVPQEAEIPVYSDTQEEQDFVPPPAPSLERGEPVPSMETGTTTRSMLSIELKREGLGKLQQEVANCTACRLASTRNKTVFGYGNPNAKLVFIGEAPGMDENNEGLPFVGKAGQLLTKIIESIHLSREDVYIMNLIKCWPPGNREPKPDEIECCRPFLLKQLNYLEPKIICTLGRFASQSLLNEPNTPISRMRGQLYYWQSIPVMPTFHPSYLLRNDSEKRKVWEDMKKIRDLLKEL